MDNKKMGWFSVYRSLMASDFWLSEKFTRPQAWVDMLGLANHKPRSFRKRGILVKVERGQVGWSIKALADRWRWSPSTVKLFLNELKKDLQINCNFSNLTTVITIINYDEYQPTEGNNDSQTERKPIADEYQPNINNNDKEDKEEKEVKKGPSSSGDILSKELRASFDLFWSLWPNKKSKGTAERAWKKIKPGKKLLPHVMNGLNRAKASKEWAKDEGKYIPHPATWLNAKGWEDEYEPAKGSGNNGGGPRRQDAGDTIREAEEAFEKEEGQPL